MLRRRRRSSPPSRTARPATRPHRRPRHDASDEHRDPTAVESLQNPDLPQRAARVEPTAPDLLGRAQQARLVSRIEPRPGAHMLGHVELQARRPRTDHPDQDAAPGAPGAGAGRQESRARRRPSPTRWRSRPARRWARPPASRTTMAPTSCGQTLSESRKSVVALSLDRHAGHLHLVHRASGCTTSNRAEGPLLALSSRRQGEPMGTPEVALQGIVASVLARWPTAGLAVAVVRGGDPTWYHSHGVANVTTGTTVTPSTVFRIGSLTKTITAVAVLQLWSRAGSTSTPPRTSTSLPSGCARRGRISSPQRFDTCSRAHRRSRLLAPPLRPAPPGLGRGRGGASPGAAR